MIAHSVYNLIHLVGALLTFLALGSVLAHALNGGTKADDRWRTPAAVTHGIGLFLILLGGFGMLARLGIDWPWPGWAITKVVLWVLLGGATVAIRRAGTRAAALWWGVLLVGGLAVYLGLFKPY